MTHSHTETHMQMPLFITKPVHKIYLQKYKNRLDDTAFFEQEEVYWKPASKQRALYQQMAKKKYREILRPQIQ